MKIPQRKDEHIHHTMGSDVACRVPTGFNDVTLVHCALPDVSYADIDTGVDLFGKHQDAPFMISALTGGSEMTGKINRSLAELANEYNVPISVGSQRAMHVEAELRSTYDIRSYAPDVLLFSNVGIAQLITMTDAEVEDLVSSIGADVLAVHLNPLQEVLQPEGDTNFVGGVERLREIKDALSIPVIVKETGAGISYETATRLSFLDGVDVAGVGGTSFAAVEYHRTSDAMRRSIARAFWDWGVPTVASIVECAEVFDTLIASGGVRTGIDIAKSVALGATCAGIAQPFLTAVYKRPHDEARHYVDTLIEELKVTMFLVGAATITELHNVPVVIGGTTRDYLAERGFSVEYLARKGDFI